VQLTAPTPFVPHPQQQGVAMINPPQQPPSQPVAYSSAGQKEKLESALDFLDQVKTTFDDRIDVYNQFLDIMKDFKAHNIDTPGVIARVRELFRGYPHLILGFNTFLPPGYKIELEEDELHSVSRTQQPLPPHHPHSTQHHIPHQDEEFLPQQQQTPQIPPPAAAARKYPEEFDQARSYVRKIKMRFEYQPHIYRSFLEILHTYHNKQLTIQDVYAQVAKLFKDNPDLLEEFKQFLPDPAINKQPRESQTTSVGMEQSATVDATAASATSGTASGTATGNKQMHAGTRRTARSTAEVPSRRTRSGRADAKDCW
jgi:paired amphipathic helix protein Sin3a